MATISDIVKAAPRTPKVPASVRALKPSPSVVRIVKQHQRIMGLLDPILQHNRTIQSIVDQVAPLDRYLEAAHLGCVDTAFSIADSLPPGFDELLATHASSSCLAFDQIDQSVLDALGNSQRLADLTAHLGVADQATLLATSREFVAASALGGLPPSVRDLLASISIPQVDLGDAVLRAIVERDDLLRAIERQSLEMTPEDESETTEPDEREDSEREAAPRVAITPFPPELLHSLRIDPNRMRELSPEQFELLIADRLEKMGFVPTRTGHVNRPDGGIDIIAVPRERHMFGCVIAVQCEHHWGQQKTGRPKLDSLLRWRGREFQVGVLVTNTTFTREARRDANLSAYRSFVRLRDFEDVSRWIQDNYNAALEWREIPDEIQLTGDLILRLSHPPLAE